MTVTSLANARQAKTRIKFRSNTHSTERKRIMKAKDVPLGQLFTTNEGFVYKSGGFSLSLGQIEVHLLGKISLETGNFQFYDRVVTAIDGDQGVGLVNLKVELKG